MKVKTIGAAMAVAVFTMTAAHAQTGPGSSKQDGAKAHVQHKSHAAAERAVAVKRAPGSHQHGRHQGKHKAGSPHVYGGLMLGHSESGIGGLERSKSALGLVLGTQLNERFAVEAAYQDLGNRRYTNGDLGKVSTDMYSLSALGFVPVAKGVRAFGKVGLAHTSAAVRVDGLKVGVSNVAPVLGAGVDWRLDKRVSLRTAVDVYPDFAGSDRSLTNYTIGVNYRF